MEKPGGTDIKLEESPADGSGKIPDPRSRQLGLNSILILILVGASLIVHSFSFPIYFDDETIRFFILPRENRFNIPECFWGNYVDLPVASKTFRPVVTLSAYFNYEISGSDPIGWHAVNILFHLAAVIALYYFLKSIISRSGAFLTALFFSIHPLTTQPMWILLDRSEVFVALFILIGLIFHRKYRIRGSKMMLLPAFFSFSLALMSKETAVTFPLLAILTDLFFEKKRSFFRRILNLRFVFPFVLYFALLGTYLVYRSAVFQGVGGYGSLELFNFSHALPVLQQYLEWMYLVPLSSLGLGIIYIIATLILLAPVFPKPMRYGNIWMLVALLPVHNLCQKWYLYLPLMGFCLIPAYIVEGLRDKGRRRLRGREFSLGMAAGVVLMGVIIISYTWLSVSELKKRDKETGAALTLLKNFSTLYSDVPDAADITFRLPKGIKMNELEGEWFNPKTFRVEKNPSPLRGIVNDLNKTRYLNGAPVFSRLVQPLFRLYYDDNDISVRLKEFRERNPVPLRPQNKLEVLIVSRELTLRKY